MVAIEFDLMFPSDIPITQHTPVAAFTNTVKLIEAEWRIYASVN